MAPAPKRHPIPVRGAEDACMYRRVLSAGQCHTMRVRAGTTLQCTEGFLWLTFEPDAGRVPGADCLASPQGLYVAPGAGRIYLSAVRKAGQAAFEVAEAPAQEWAWQRAVRVARRIVAALSPAR